MSFPISPTDGQQITINNIVYQYSSANTVWNRVPAISYVSGNGFTYYSNQINSSVTIPSGYNTQSIGPLTQSPGVTVTLSPGSRWIIL